MVQKIHLKMRPVSSTNTHHDVRNLVNLGVVKNTKPRISWERNITFLWNKKILNLCLQWHILRSYRFVAEVTFKVCELYRKKPNLTILTSLKPSNFLHQPWQPRFNPLPKTLLSTPLKAAGPKLMILWLYNKSLK